MERSKLVKPRTSAYCDGPAWSPWRSKLGTGSLSQATFGGPKLVYGREQKLHWYLGLLPLIIRERGSCSIEYSIPRSYG